MEKLTAAHRALPFQTWVEVTNLANGKQVNVRITDRGPFVRGRIIDVSMAAARQLDMVRSGTARVKLKVIVAPVNEPQVNSPPVNAPPVNAPPVNALDNPQVNSQSATGEYAVQAGAFSDPVRAEFFRQSLPYSDSRVLPRQEGSSLWRVVVGHALTLQGATTLAAEITRTAGQALVVKEYPSPK
jgi:rare lipoprotein A